MHNSIGDVKMRTAMGRHIFQDLHHSILRKKGFSSDLFYETSQFIISFKSFLISRL